MAMPGSQPADPLFVLREYRHLAPWNLRDLTTLAAAILDAAGVRPTNAAASAHPTERTIRFYVTRHLVTPPEGRGTAATYSYRHLLEVLGIKLRQMEGATLAAIARELSETTGDVLERRVASALGRGVPPPNQLPLTGEDTPPRGRAGRALRAWAAAPAPGEPNPTTARTWQRTEVAEGVELHIRDDHPLANLGAMDSQIADAVRLALGRLLSQSRPASPSAKPAAPSPERTGQRV